MNSEVPAEAIEVVIVEDHNMVALGLISLLADAEGIETVGWAQTSEEAVKLIERVKPDVVLMDYRLPHATGADTARLVAEAGVKTNIVMVTAAVDRISLSKALDAGCCGFISKSADQSDLVAAIVAASSGDSYFTDDMMNHLVHLRRYDDPDIVELSEREVEILQGVADGLFPDDIAEQLCLSPHTIKNHLRHAMAKLQAHTKLEAVVKALRARIITIES